MARGKNYVNQNKGMILSSGGTNTNTKSTTSLNIAKQKKSTVVETCFYGVGCTRKDCIYKHPPSRTSTSNTTGSIDDVLKSDAPCKPYLVGMCSFNSRTCNKRHVIDPMECEKLLIQYSLIPCRHGIDCKQITTGACLYSHTPIEEKEVNATNSIIPIFQRKGGMLPPLPMNNNGFFLNQQQQQLLQHPNNNNFCSLASSSNNNNNNNNHHISQFRNEYSNNNSIPNNSSPAVPGSSLRVALPTGMIQQQHLQQQKQQQQSSSTSPIPMEPMKSQLHDSSFTPAGRLTIRNSPHSAIQQQAFVSTPSTFQSATTLLQQQQHHQQYPSQHHYVKVPTRPLQQHGIAPFTSAAVSSATVVNTNNDIDFPPLGSLSIKDAQTTTTTSTKAQKLQRHAPPQQQQQQQQRSPSLSTRIKSTSATTGSSIQSTTGSTTTSSSSSSSTPKFNINAQEFRPGGW